MYYDYEVIITQLELTLYFTPERKFNTVDIKPVRKLTAVTLILQFWQAFQETVITHEKLNLMIRYGGDIRFYITRNMQYIAGK